VRCRSDGNWYSCCGCTSVLAAVTLALWWKFKAAGKRCAQIERHGHRIDERPGNESPRMTSWRSEKIAPESATPAARALASYRARLAVLLTSIERATAPEVRTLDHAVAKLVDELSVDLLRLYQKQEHHLLIETDRAVVIPALERLRDVLRHRHRRSRPFGDTVKKAIDAGAVGAS